MAISYALATFVIHEIHSTRRVKIPFKSLTCTKLDNSDLYRLRIDDEIYDNVIIYTLTINDYKEDVIDEMQKNSQTT